MCEMESYRLREPSIEGRASEREKELGQQPEREKERRREQETKRGRHKTDIHSSFSQPLYCNCILWRIFQRFSFLIKRHMNVENSSELAVQRQRAAPRVYLFLEWCMHRNIDSFSLTSFKTNLKSPERVTAPTYRVISLSLWPICPCWLWSAKPFFFFEGSSDFFCQIILWCGIYSEYLFYRSGSHWFKIVFNIKSRCPVVWGEPWRQQSTQPGNWLSPGKNDSQWEAMLT